ncbi:MAG: glycerol-3-phosphate dehydrogenase [Rhodospirillaceae bacterium]|nr:glycerol-3-phosphate dehydrogenase [Rhodospirillaceae bacterium]
MPSALPVIPGGAAPLASAPDYDLVVIGGGINGVGIANDAAGRGLKVALIERDDLAQATSSASTKLIHGGLRYLEYYAFRLVREALQEREVLSNKVPHLVRPLRLVLPLGQVGGRPRPAWMVRLGLWLYDHLAAHPNFPATRTLKLSRGPQGAPLHDEFRQGFEFSDATVDDSRLVIANAMQAREGGADIFTRSAVTGAVRDADHWVISRSNGADLTARVLVNAAGPWVRDILDHLDRPGPDVRLVQGSHIVVPRLYDGDHAYLLQQDDGRVVFVIPYQDGFSLIGTTEVLLAEAQDPPTVSEAEIEYLVTAVGRYFKEPPVPNDIVWQFAGIRPLFDEDDDDPKAFSREYHLHLDADDGPALLSVYGGKITTYRPLAEKVLAALKPYLPAHGPAWTVDTPLPGAEHNADMDGDLHLPDGLLASLLARHGSRTAELLRDCQCMEDLGVNFGGHLYALEIDYFMDREWACSGEDVLWRRSKLGLFLNEEQRNAVTKYVADRRARVVRF